MIEVLSLFNGSVHHVVGRARADSGIRKAIRRAPQGDGWGVRLRGSKEALIEIGAWNAGGGYVYPLDARQDMFVDCEVVCSR